MNLHLALAADALPDRDENYGCAEAPIVQHNEKRKQRWGGALSEGHVNPYAGKAIDKGYKRAEFAYLYQHEKPFRPDWADQRPGSTPQLPLKPPGGRP